MESRLQLIKRNYPLSHLKHGLPDMFCEDTISETHLNLIKRSDGLWILDEEELITVKIAENKQFLELCESVDLQINSSGILQHDNQYDFSDFRARHEALLFTASIIYNAYYLNKPIVHRIKRIVNNVLIKRYIEPLLDDIVNAKDNTTTSEQITIASNIAVYNSKISRLNDQIKDIAKFVKENKHTTDLPTKQRLMKYAKEFHELVEQDLLVRKERFNRIVYLIDTLQAVDEKITNLIALLYNTENNLPKWISEVLSLNYCNNITEKYIEKISFISNDEDLDSSVRNIVQKYTYSLLSDSANPRIKEESNDQTLLSPSEHLNTTKQEFYNALANCINKSNNYNFEEYISSEDLNNTISSLPDKIYVQYYSDNPQVTYKENTNEYPSVIFPCNGTIVFPYRRKKTSRRGYTEAFFEELVKKQFESKDFEVIGDASILLHNGFHPYEPDIAIIEKSNINNIRIDIEVDEPYSGLTRRPTHYINCGDEVRDINLASAGWIVIRFNEEAIVKHPHECLAYIARVLEQVASEYRRPEHLKIPIQTHSKWTMEESIKMATNRYRESYLNIDGFGEKENCKVLLEDITQSQIERDAYTDVETNLGIYPLMPKSTTLQNDDVISKSCVTVHPAEKTIDTREIRRRKIKRRVNGVECNEFDKITFSLDYPVKEYINDQTQNGYILVETNNISLSPYDFAELLRDKTVYACLGNYVIEHQEIINKLAVGSDIFLIQPNVINLSIDNTLSSDMYNEYEENPIISRIVDIKLCKVACKYADQFVDQIIDKLLNKDEPISNTISRKMEHQNVMIKSESNGCVVSNEVWTINKVMEHYFNSMNHKYVASLRAMGDKSKEKEILLSLAKEDATLTFVYSQLLNINSGRQAKTTFDFKYCGKTYRHNNAAEAIQLIKNFLSSKGISPTVCGVEITDLEYNLKIEIGCIYDNEYYDFDIQIENRGSERGKGVLSHIGDVPNERQDILSSLKAKIIERHYGLALHSIYSVCIDVKHASYRIRKVKRRTSEIERVLKEITTLKL